MNFVHPTKDSANPVMVKGASWDSSISYVSVHTDPSWPSDSKYRVWYAAYDADSDLCSCYAYSSDGITWTKPNLGLISYDGSTNNNIFLPIGAYMDDAIYDSDLGLYIVTVTGVPKLIDIYTSSNPSSGFALTKSITPEIDQEIMSILHRADGKWIVYTQDFIALVRKIGAFLSDTTDIDGTYVYQGVVIDNGAAANSQRYSCHVQNGDDGNIYAFVSNYSSATERIWMGYWRSSDGLTWTEIVNNWFNVGTGGEWDDEMVISNRIIKIGSQSYVYYSGSPENHAAAAPRGSQMGRACLIMPSGIGVR